MRRSSQRIFVPSALALALAVAATPGAAQIGEPRNETTYFTFTAPLELPGGKTLPPGRYVFELLDSASNRHVVRILSADRGTLHATVMAIPAQRQQPAEEPEVRFIERPADAPAAIRTWWYPGQIVGHEFIYPHEQARRLAANDAQGVLTTAGAEADAKTARLARIDREGRETPVSETRAAATAGETPSAVGEGAAAPSPSQAQGRQTEARTRLPQTASPLPAVALLGAASLAGAAMLRVARRQRRK